MRMEEGRKQKDRGAKHLGGSENMGGREREIEKEKERERGEKSTPTTSCEFTTNPKRKRSFLVMEMPYGESLRLRTLGSKSD